MIAVRVNLYSNVEKFISQSGNWTPVSRVTGGDTHHYTNWEFGSVLFKYISYFKESERNELCYFISLQC